MKAKFLGKTPQKRKEHAPSTEVQMEPLESAIDKQIGDLLPQGSRTAAVARISSLLMSEHFSGPIAHPRHLGEYEAVSPGAADRIISMAEAQQSHHMHMDYKVIEAEVADRKLGMLLGAGTFTVLIVCALVAAYLTDNAVIPGLFLGTAAIGGVGLFIRGRSASNK